MTSGSLTNWDAHEGSDQDLRELQASGEKLLKAGGIANARVTTVSRGRDRWVIKDFNSKPFPIRHTIGRALIAHEMRNLRKLDDLQGVPVDPTPLGTLALGYRYVEGETLPSLKKRKGAVDGTFFLRLEALVKEMHLRGFTHLDLRNGNNILVTEGQRPHLLDFQCGLWTNLLPGPGRRLLETVDYSGIYKWWSKLSPEDLDEKRRSLLNRINQVRHLWPFNTSPSNRRRRKR